MTKPGFRGSNLIRHMFLYSAIEPSSMITIIQYKPVPLNLAVTANNGGADQTVWMCRLICVFDNQRKVCFLIMGLN